MVIALTHMRVHNDQAMIRNCKSVDLFLGGHDHIVYYERHEDNVVIKSGCDFRHFSVLHLETVQGDDPVLVNALENDIKMVDEAVKPDVEYTAIIGKSNKYLLKAKLVAVSRDTPDDPDVENHIEVTYKKFDEKMKKPVCYLDADIDSRFSKVRSEETPIGNFITDLMRKEHNADCAVLNSGNIRADKIFKAGQKMVLGDWYDMIPFTIPVCLIEITGQQILTMLENSVSKLPSLSGRFLQVSYIHFEFDPRKPEGERVNDGSVKVAGKPLDASKKYTMAAPDFLIAGKDGFEDILNAEVLISDENGPELKLVLTRFFDDSYSSSKKSEVNLFRENQETFSPNAIRSKIDTKLESHRDKIKRSLTAIRRLN
jgi:5'-nucleotidase